MIKFAEVGVVWTVNIAVSCHPAILADPLKEQLIESNSMLACEVFVAKFINKGMENPYGLSKLACF